MLGKISARRRAARITLAHAPACALFTVLLLRGGAAAAQPCMTEAWDPSSNQVVHTPKPAGTPCPDSNLCNGNETCDGKGVCKAGTPVLCAPKDTCHEAGACNPATGVCSSPVRGNGVPCDDSDPGTTGDTCTGGVCAGNVAAACATAGRDFQEEAPLHPGGLIETCQPASPQGGWLDVTACHAPGDPDWSFAFNAAVDLVLAGYVPSHTIFVPGGYYPVAFPINVHGYGVRIIGEDPATTTLAWAGAPYLVSGPRPGYPNAVFLYPAERAQQAWMFLVDSAFAAEIRRLTLDGASAAEAAIRQANFSNNGAGYCTCGDGICAASVWCGESAASCPADCPQDPSLHIAAYSSSVQNRFSDLVIQGFARGIWGGMAGGSQDDSTLVLRVRFADIGQAWVGPIGKPITSLAAVVQSSQNALDWDVQDSTFDHCVTGLWASAGSAISVNAWDNAFQSSTIADVVASGTSFYDLRGNTSYQSRRFVLSNGLAPGQSVDEDGYTGNGSAGGPGPLTMTIEDNVILDPTCPAGDVTCAPIDLRTTGGYSIVDNAVRSAVAPAIRFRKAFGYTAGNFNFQGVPVILLGNRFSMPQTSPAANAQDDNDWWQAWLDPTQAYYPPVPAINAYKSLDNVQADLSAYAPPSMQTATPELWNRPVFDVVADLIASDPGLGTTAPHPYCGQIVHVHGAALSAWISQTLGGLSRPFLYFPAGCYFMDDASVVVGGGVDVQILGDGLGTQLLSGSPGYVLRFLAPARATLRDLAFIGTSIPGALRINAFDAAGDQIHLSGSQITSKAALGYPPFPPNDPHAALVVAGFDHALVRADHTAFGAANDVIRVVGGGAAQAGSALTRGLELNGLSGFGSTDAFYQVASWGKIVSQGGEIEQAWGLDLRNTSGYLTLTGTRYLVDEAAPTAATWAPWAAAYPASGKVSLDGFHGNVSFLSMLTGLAFHAPQSAPVGDPGFGVYFVASRYWDSVDAIDTSQLSPTPSTPIGPMAAGGAPAGLQQIVDCTPAVNLPGYARGAILDATVAGIPLYGGPVSPGLWQCADVSHDASQAAALRNAYADLRAAKVTTPEAACSTSNTDVVIDRVFINPNDTTLPTGTVRVQRVTPASNQ
jgi:hypothetical protein